MQYLWTKEPPQSDGFYFFRGYFADSFVRVNYVKDGLTHDNYYVGSGYECKNCKMVKARDIKGVWAGPIIEPVEHVEELEGK